MGDDLTRGAGVPAGVVEPNSWMIVADMYRTARIIMV
jgi:hypothetical protein